jgi:hypothetical protein
MFNSCLVLGDSIAKGLAPFFKGCAVIAKVGVSSAWILAHAHAGHFNHVYISSGSNDPYNHHLVMNLEATRALYPDATFTWVAPVNSRARSAVYAAAGYNRVVVFIPGRDHVHPKSYVQLARIIGE